MENFSNFSPMTWVIILSAAAILGIALFSKVLKFALKLAVILVMALFIIYFLQQAGIIELPFSGQP